MARPRRQRAPQADRRRSAPPPRVAAPARPAAWAVALERLGGPIAIAIAAASVLVWTWGTWPDAIVDFGRELYLAWQVAEGRTLYVDLAHFSGPLSVELNALVFRLFGPGVRTLVVLNVVLAAGLTALVYDLLSWLAGRLAATVGGLVFVLLFGCMQLTRIGNYNWVCPYSHELTHGALLAVAALWCLARRARSAQDGWVVAAGVACGLLVLTKVEPLLAGGLAVAVAVTLTLVAERASPARWVRTWALLVAGAAVPIALAVLALAPRMPLETLLRWPLGHWLAAARPELRTSSFYQSGMGLDDGGANLGAAVMAFGSEALVAGLAVGAAMLLRPVGARAIVAAALGLATAAALWRWVDILAWGVIPRAYPLWTAIVVGTAFTDFVRRRDDRAARLRAAIRTALAVLAAALLAKMLLNARIFHYGFVLAMPATLVLVTAMVAWLPAFVDRLGGYGGAVRAIGLGVVAAAVATHLTFMGELVALKRGTMGTGADAFRIDDRGALGAALLRKIEAFVGPEQTLVVLPQGVMLNYLARRRNPTPYYLFDRTSRLLWGEEAMTESVRAAAPDWIAYVERGRSEDPFGQSFLALREWIAANYTPAWQVGMPFTGAREPGAMLLRRRPAS